MSNIADCLECPNCGMKGTMEIVVRTKTAEAVCEACCEMVTDRVPYPKHRIDPKGYQYHFKISSVRPLWTSEDDETYTQEEWENRNS